MHEDEDLVVDLCLEFLEAFIHQTLYQREIYSPSLFERRRLYGIAVRRARHPDLVQYIQNIVASLKVSG
jgi:mitotic spindle assembly checkpoint protein MAD2B